MARVQLGLSAIVASLAVAIAVAVAVVGISGLHNCIANRYSIGTID